MDYVIEHLKETTCLHKFRCGVPAMDRFIQDGLNLSIDNHYCKAYIVKDIRANNIIALFALSFDSLDLDIDDKTDMMSGISTTDTPLLTDNYKDVFLTNPDIRPLKSPIWPYRKAMDITKDLEVLSLKPLLTKRNNKILPVANLLQ